MTNTNPSMTTTQAVSDKEPGSDSGTTTAVTSSSAPVNTLAPQRSVTLPLYMESPQQNNWGWAAVTASIARFYDRNSIVTQCSLANYAFTQTTCCVNGASPQCNMPFSLEQALKSVEHLNMSFPNAFTAEQIIKEISAGRPLVALIQLQDSSISQHLVIHGYDTNASVPGSVTPSTTISIADPWYGNTVIALADFPTRYRRGGTWTKSYTTR